MTAVTLELMGRVEGQKSSKSKNDHESKMLNEHFSPPSRKEVVSNLNTATATFTRQFKAYQSEVLGEKVNWTKLTQEQYEGFVEWFRKRAETLRDEEEKAKAEKERKQEEKKAQEARKRIDSIAASIKQAQSDLEVLEALKLAGYDHLIGDDA